MRQLVRKAKFYLTYLLMLVKFNWQIDTAYRSNVINMVLGTVSWNLTYVFFLKVIIAKVTSIAGYTFNDMIVFTFVTEIIFYITWILSYISSERFVDYVKDGDFDTLLIKPISILLQISTIRISIFETLVSSIGPLTMYGLLIYTSHQFSPTPRAIILSLLSGIVGICIIHLFRFSYAMLVFWMKQARNLMRTLGFLADVGSFPMEAYKEPVRSSLLLIAPTIVAGGVPAAYILEKATNFDFLLYELIVFFCFLTVFTILWRKGLPLYESASS